MFYPPACQCCGDATEEFLTIDHKDRNGAEHRRQDPSAINLYEWLKQHNYPEGFRVLCYNCNCSRGARGYCPHERKNGGWLVV